MRFLPLLLLAACATKLATVDRQPGIDGSWSEGSSSLDITGPTATLSFQGRLFVFGVDGHLRGTVAAKEVRLVGPGLRIEADRDRIVIAGGKAEVKRPLAELPRGGRFVWRDGELKPG